MCCSSMLPSFVDALRHNYWCIFTRITCESAARVTCHIIIIEHRRGRIKQEQHTIIASKNEHQLCACFRHFRTKRALTRNQIRVRILWLLVEIRQLTDRLYAAAWTSRACIISLCISSDEERKKNSICCRCPPKSQPTATTTTAMTVCTHSGASASTRLDA